MDHPSSDFWEKLENLIAASNPVIDRPKGTAHPHYPDLIYPLDYGFLEDTTSPDGAGIDVWDLDTQAQTLNFPHSTAGKPDTFFYKEPDENGTSQTHPSHERA